MADEDPEQQAEKAVDALLAEFNGDARAAIKALLHDIEMLARDSESVSRGFVRRQRVRLVLRGAGLA
ncbi:hypothetical protein [Lichenifustis flavocetrariae]|uniref:Uncharacterized protein n=1 Tax=Lichenifustis flavocetrariae TaxID=2949735 RepID=A0AA41Z9Z2_9HYPH|nr:hypothetical protein [Lichenifustis flavocetrariae]MCW6513015.1 hypothetical protein [Lichenifustis flavocetrariae]